MAKKKKRKTKIVYVHDVETLPPQRNTFNNGPVSNAGGMGSGGGNGNSGPSAAQTQAGLEGLLGGLRDTLAKASGQQPNGNGAKALPPPPVSTIDPLDPDVQKESVGRLVQLFKALGEKPEPILDLFYRLGIPWERRRMSLDGAPEDVEYILIRAAELEEGEKRNQGQGSVAQRVYGDTIGQAMSPNHLHSHHSSDPGAGPEVDPEPAVPFEHDEVQLLCDNGTPPDLDDNDSQDYVTEDDDPYDLGKVQG